MDWVEYKRLETISYNFYDTIDFKKFFPKSEFVNEIDIDELMYIISDYYEHWESASIPKELQGYVFNCINAEEFAEYLKKRYNLHLRTETIEKFYLYE